MTESRIEKFTRISQEMAAAVSEMRADAADVTTHAPETAALVEELSVTCDRWSQWEEVAAVVLAHLTAAGRLIPAGGMALTAEQWAHYQRMAAEPRFTELSREALGVMKWPENPLLPPAKPPVKPATERTEAERQYIDIVFDGPPDAEPGRFVEVENHLGASIKVGEWIERGDGFWALRILDGLVDCQEGHILTAEDMEDVRTLFMKGSTVDPEFHRAKERLRPVLFPATEPADEERCDFYAETESGDARQCTRRDGHTAHHHIEPVCAEPTEAEARAGREFPADAFGEVVRIGWATHYFGADNEWHNARTGAIETREA
ncbi:hypothetical protein N806_20310 [Rhodococcus sp. P27]|nr:hypothetical protein N806_20310 [Rhodococcus sp. P27]